MVSFENRMEMFNIFTSNEIKKKPVCERYEFVIDAYHESEPVPCPSGQYSFHGGVAHAVPLMIGDVPNQAY